jgi:hypothetical protein
MRDVSEGDEEEDKMRRRMRKIKKRLKRYCN